MHQHLCFARTLAITIFILSLVCPAIAQTQFDKAGGQQLVQLINQERISQGLPPLAVDQRLTQATRKHTEFLAAHEALSHRFEGEPSLDVRFANENLPADRVL